MKKQLLWSISYVEVGMKMEVNHNIAQKRGITIFYKKEELQAAYNQLSILLTCSCCNPEAVSNLIPHVGVVEVEDD